MDKRRWRYLFELLLVRPVLLGARFRVVRRGRESVVARRVGRRLARRFVDRRCQRGRRNDGGSNGQVLGFDGFAVVANRIVVDHGRFGRGGGRQAHEMVAKGEGILLERGEKGRKARDRKRRVEACKRF